MRQKNACMRAVVCAKFCRGVQWLKTLEWCVARGVLRRSIPARECGAWARRRDLRCDGTDWEPRDPRLHRKIARAKVATRGPVDALFCAGTPGVSIFYGDLHLRRLAAGTHRCALEGPRDAFPPTVSLGRWAAPPASSSVSSPWRASRRRCLSARRKSCCSHARHAVHASSLHLTSTGGCGRWRWKGGQPAVRGQLAGRARRGN